MTARRDRLAFVVTCEHGGHRIPARWRARFAGHDALLRSHRGWDFGALAMARALGAALGVEPIVSTVSRLLVDLNRSAGHPRLFSEVTRTLDAAARAQILREHWRPYRERVERAVREAIDAGCRVVHVSSHSFTPQLDGVPRQADVGLLYDPSDAFETDLCVRWRARLLARAPELRVRRNYPYRGRSDGLATHLRRVCPPGRYAGIELELNQRLLAGAAAGRLRADVVASLQEALAA